MNGLSLFLAGSPSRGANILHCRQLTGERGKEWMRLNRHQLALNGMMFDSWSTSPSELE